MINDKPQNWHKLEDDFKNERSVVLFLGTGIDSGAPKGKDYSWDALLNHLVKYAVSQILPYNDEGDVSKRLMTNSSILKKNTNDIDDLKKQIAIDAIFPRDVKSTIVKQTLGNEVYVNLIQDFLYGEIEREDIDAAGEKYVDFIKKGKKDEDIEGLSFFSLFSLADFILRNKNIRAVVTQNYDQFLCEAINYLKKTSKYNDYYKGDIRSIKPNTICDWKGQTGFTYEDINIYHVHGFIPRYDELQAPHNNKIVLSLDEFYEDSRNVYSWQIASQLHFLSQYTCIFCGLSLNDYTSQRLLHYVKEKHHGNLYYLTAALNTNDGDSRLLNRLKNSYHEKNGLTVIYDEKNFNHLFKKIGELHYGK